MVVTMDPAGAVPVPAIQIAGDEQALADRYYELLALGPEELERELAQIASTEHSLPEPLRYGEVRARLLAWLQLSPEDRRILARSFERALGTLPAEVAETRREAERAVVLNSLSYTEFEQLAGVLDWCADEAARLAA
jgi:hypothetical protein